MFNENFHEPSNYLFLYTFLSYFLFLFKQSGMQKHVNPPLYDEFIIADENKLSRSNFLLLMVIICCMLLHGTRTFAIITIAFTCST